MYDHTILIAGSIVSFFMHTLFLLMYNTFNIIDDHEYMYREHGNLEREWAREQYKFTAAYNTSLDCTPYSYALLLFNTYLPLVK